MESHSSLGKKEIAYTMLDILFLLGNSRKSATLLDPPIIRKNETGLEEVITEKEVGGLYKDQVVVLDRTTQLLTSTAIAIADILKQKVNLHEKNETLKSLLESPTEFEAFAFKEINDKSWLISKLLSIEILFFSSKISQWFRNNHNANFS